jgi:hypothetical protein
MRSKTLEHSGDGLTLWYGTDDTPAPFGHVQCGSPVSLTVGVRPANLTNSVDVEYRVNGGPKRLLFSRLLKGESAAGQLFRAVFPYLPPGSTVEYAPILRSLGRRIGWPLGSISPSSFSVLPAAQSRGHAHKDTSSATSAVSKATRPELRQRFPYTLERLGQVRASLAPAEVIGQTPDGLRVNFRITGGEIIGERFNATVETGGADALRIREDGTAIVAVRTTLRTDDGARVFTEYSGVLDLGENGFHKALRGEFPPKPKVYLAPRFVSASPAYSWLNRLQCMGIGYVTMADLEVNYDLYVMHLIDRESPQ